MIVEKCTAGRDMMKKKKLSLTALAVIMAVMLLAGCNDSGSDSSGSVSGASSGSSAIATVDESGSAAPSAEGLKIAYTSGYLGNSWRTQYEEAVNARFEMYKEIGVVADYTFVACNADVTEQLNQLNQLLQEDYDLIMIDAVSTTSLSAVIEEANAKGIKLMLGNTICPYESVPCISLDLSNYAKAEAYYLCEKIGDGGNIVEMYGVAGNGSGELFEIARTEVYEQYDINVLAQTNGYWNDADAQTEMAPLLSTYGDQIDAVFCEDGMTYGVIQAYLNADMPLVPMGGDYFNAFIQYWYDNQDTVDSIIIPNSPYAAGWLYTDCAVYLAAGYEIDPSLYVENQLDPTIKNWCPVALPYFIFEKDQMKHDWLSNFPDTKVMTIDDAYALMEGKEETAAIELYFDDGYVASLFGQAESVWF
jgi:ribose transport system substrate-binding protein